MTHVWHDIACRHGAPLQRIDRLLDIGGHAGRGTAPRVVCRRLGEPGRSPCPAPAFMFGGAGADIARAVFGQVDVPESKCFALEDAALGPEGIVVKDSTGFCGEAIGVPIEVAARVIQRLNARAATTRKVSGAIVSLFGGAAPDPAALLTDVLPRLWILSAAGHRLDDLLMAVPEALPEDAHAMLLAAGLREGQLLRFRLADDVVRAPRVVVPSPLRSGARFSPFMCRATSFWTARLRASLGLPAPRPARRLFLSPRDTAEPSGVADWQAIEAAAADAGMAVIHPASLGLTARAALFGEACSLLGFDGAALMEACVHAPAGTAVCIIRGGLVRTAGTAALALALGHQAGVLFGATDQEDPLAPVHIAQEDLRSALASLTLT